LYINEQKTKSVTIISDLPHHLSVFFFVFLFFFTANAWQNNEMMVRGKMAEVMYCNESTSEASVQWPVDQ